MVALCNCRIVFNDRLVVIEKEIYNRTKDLTVWQSSVKSTPRENSDFHRIDEGTLLHLPDQQLSMEDDVSADSLQSQLEEFDGDAQTGFFHH